MLRARAVIPLLLAGLMMAAGFNVNTLSAPKVSVTMSATESSALALGSAQYSANLPASGAYGGGTITYTVGTGNGAVSLMWTDTSTVAASAADTVRLMGTGGPTNAFGQAFDFGKIKTMTVTCASANTNDVVLGNAADSTWVGPFGSATHTVACRPGGSITFALPNTGYTVAANAKKLKIANGGAGTAVKYTIMLFGVP